MGLNKLINTTFKRGYEQKCFQLITESYATALGVKSINVNLHENDISALLHQHIHQNPKRLQWGIHSNVEKHIFNDDIKIEKGFAAKFSRIDLSFTVINSELEYVYHMEAKNLKEKNVTLKRRYINTGIDNFISGKYENGCLLGYVLEGHSHKCIDGINSLLKKDKRIEEYLVKSRNELHDNYYESIHEKDLLLKHFIFDFASLKLT